MIFTAKWRSHAKTVLVRSFARNAIALAVFVLPTAWALGQTTSESTGTAAPPSADTSAKPAAQIEEVLITGTQIRGVAPPGAQVLSVDQDAILSSGATTSSDAFKKIPQVLTFGADESGRSANQGGNANRSYGTGINIRGLGPSSTLVLLNGHRLPTSGLQGQFVDPSIIPIGVIDRIEVVPDGSSAIYGADAVAGVANIITKRSYDGMETRASYGWANGYDQQQFNQLGGFGWGTGQIVADYEYAGHSNLAGSSRNYFTNDQRTFGGHNYSTNFAAPGNILVGTTSYALAPGNGRNINAAQLVPGTSNLLNQVAVQDILPSQRRNTIFLAGDQTITDRIKLSADAYYTERNFGFHDPAPTATLSVPSTNPFFVSPVAQATSVNVAYSFINDIGAANVVGFSRSTAANLGAAFTLPADWRLNLTTTLGRDNEQYLANTILRALPLAAALANSNPATALNPFGSGGANNNPSTIAGLIGFADTRSRFDLRQYVAKADGSLFSLPGGAVRAALGAEYRKESLFNSLFTNRNTADSVIASQDTVYRSVKAVYAEAVFPLFGETNAIPGLRQLDVSTAIRRDDYSDFGSSTVPKVGITWKPVGEVLVRSTYGKSFRAPTLSDVDPLSSGGGIFSLTVVDPKSPSGRSTGISIAGGNPNVKPETAKTWTLGIEHSPTALPGLKYGLTYFNIYDDNLISFLQGNANVLIQENLYSQYIQRNPTAAQVQAVLNSGLPLQSAINPSQVTFILDGRRQNFGTSKINGFDFTADYAFDTNVGSFDVSLLGTYFIKFQNRISQSSDYQDVLGTINWPQKLRTRGTLSWKKDLWEASASLNYVDGYSNNLVTPSQQVPSWTTADLYIAYHVKDSESSRFLNGITIALTAQNIFNRDPPFVDNPIGYGFDPQVHSAIGRLVALTATKKW